MSKLWLRMAPSLRSVRDPARQLRGPGVSDSALVRTNCARGGPATGWMVGVRECSGMQRFSDRSGVVWPVHVGLHGIVLARRRSFLGAIAQRKC
eukprot:11313431-Alexandrium_andersonii.AAC.1